MARKKFEFWLNDQRQEDWIVYELIGKLKKPARGQGQFTRAIREGIRLWASLRDGQIDVLLELFPWVREALAKATQPAPTPLTNGTENLELAREIAAQIILQSGTPGYLVQSTAAQTLEPKTITGKQLSAPKFNLPVFEDNDEMPAITIQQSANQDSALNFVTALRNMQ